MHIVYLVTCSDHYQSISHLLGMGEFLSYGTFYNIMAEHFCALEAPGALCQNVLFAICGSNEEALNTVSFSFVYCYHLYKNIQCGLFL